MSDTLDRAAARSIIASYRERPSNANEFFADLLESLLKDLAAAESGQESFRSERDVWKAEAERLREMVRHRDGVLVRLAEMATAEARS